MDTLIYRQGKLFCINQALLPEASRKSSILNSLYYDIFKEFSGATKSKKYKNFTNQQKLEAINMFAKKWLEDRKLL